MINIRLRVLGPPGSAKLTPSRAGSVVEVLTAPATPAGGARYRRARPPPRGGWRAANVVRAPCVLLFSRAYSWTHPEGWRDWPDETPATTVTSRREGANSRQMCGGLRALCHTVTRQRT